MARRNNPGIALTRQLLREAVYKTVGALSRNDARKRVDDELDEIAAFLEQGETRRYAASGPSGFAPSGNGLAEIPNRALTLSSRPVV